MKNKIGFNIFFAILAFPIGMALIKEFNRETFTFRNTGLGIVYLVTFIVAIYLTFKKKAKGNEQ